MKQRILVVDDDKLVADTLNLIFLANGFESEARYSAADAMARARDFAPELVLCDVTMPDETGLQMAERMMQELPKTRMLMLTAYTSNNAKVDAESQRMGLPIKLLNKPCRPEDLLREAKNLLGA
jgi:CheY-like chemotaxis protein